MIKADDDDAYDEDNCWNDNAYMQMKMKLMWKWRW
jgi:hypothetical protein